MRAVDRGKPGGWGRRSLKIIVPVALGGAAALAGIGLVPTGQTKVGPATLEVRALLGNARTEFRVPPFGTVSAKTHNVPLTMEVTLNSIDPVAVGKALSSATDDQVLRKTMEDGLRSAASASAVRLFVGGALLGAFAGGLMPGRRFRTLVLGAAGGFGMTALTLGGAAWGFRVDAFEQPHFTGSLERAPQIIEAVRKGSGSLEDLRSRFETAAGRLQEVIALVAEPIENPRSGSTAILHISDVHSNPLGVEIARQLATSFKVDAVLDTGDLTSFGEPIEERIGTLISSLGVPYYFVPGNHDSPEIRRALAEIHNVTVLDHRTVEVRGVKILGWADPTFTAKGGTSRDRQAEAYEKVSAEIRSEVVLSKPDLLAVHNIEMGLGSAGSTNLIVTGHGHRKKLQDLRGTTVLSVGSTGATGLGSLLVEADVDYEAEILYFVNGRLSAVDYVRFRGLGREFDIERKLWSIAATDVDAS